MKVDTTNIPHGLRGGDLLDLKKVITDVRRERHREVLDAINEVTYETGGLEDMGRYIVLGSSKEWGETYLHLEAVFGMEVRGDIRQFKFRSTVGRIYDSYKNWKGKKCYVNYQFSLVSRWGDYDPSGYDFNASTRLTPCT